jgi:threonyl-tRNA synthetase
MMTSITERIIGGYLAPIAIVIATVLLGAHVNGYLPVWLAPTLVVLMMVGTSSYRRPTITTAHRRA